jgi:hypothetical protein
MIDGYLCLRHVDSTPVKPQSRFSLRVLLLLKTTAVINDASPSFMSMQEIIRVLERPLLLTFQCIFAPDTASY